MTSQQMSSSNLPEVVAAPPASPVKEVVAAPPASPVEEVVKDAIAIASSAEMCAQDESQGIRHSLKFLNAYSFWGDAAEFCKPPYHDPKNFCGLVNKF